MPAGDASSALPPQDPNMGMPPMPDEGTPEMGMEDPGMEGGELSGKVKEIVDTANEISEKDQDTLLKYARSLKDASEEAAAGMPGSDPMAGGAPVPPEQTAGQMPMQESVVFTKKQLRVINENFGEMNNELERDIDVQKTTKTSQGKNNKVGPFDPPQRIKK